MNDLGPFNIQGDAFKPIAHETYSVSLNFRIKNFAFDSTSKHCAVWDVKVSV